MASAATLTAPVATHHLALADGASVLTYYEAGAGIPVVLLHGIGSAGRSFQQQLDGLSAQYRVIAWDAPGYGASTLLAKPHPDAGDYAAVVLALLDRLGIRRCHLLGHSLGCLMAARFAAEHPERLLSLTLCSIATGHATLPAEERDRLLAQRVGDVETLGARAMAEKRGPRLLGPDATPEMIRRVIDTMAAVKLPGYAQAARMLSTGNVQADLLRLPATLPLQIVVGEADVITPPAKNREVAALRPQTPVHGIAGAGHAMYLEKPAQLNGILAEFFAANS